MIIGAYMEADYYTRTRLSGGTGSDTFVFIERWVESGKADRILDFNPADDFIGLGFGHYGDYHPRTMQGSRVNARDVVETSTLLKFRIAGEGILVEYNKVNGYLYVKNEAEPLGTMNLLATLVGAPALDVTNFRMMSRLFTGGAGNDVLTGGAGLSEERLDGKAGNDTADYSRAKQNLMINLQLTGPQISAGEAAGDILLSIENLVGGLGDDTLTGSAEANVLAGAKGSDHLFGLSGNDTLAGDLGADLLDGGEGLDCVSYDGATSGLTVNLSDINSNTGEAEGDIFISIEGIIGSRYADILIGNGVNNLLSGGGGGDTLDGGSGSDTVTYLFASKGIVANLSVASFSTSDEATGDIYVSIENLVGSSFADVLIGDANANRLTGDAGNDKLNGMSGVDTLAGGIGDDTYYVDSASDVVIETSTGGTADKVYTTVSHTLASYVERLSATGSSSISLTGNTLANTLYGNSGANKINGGYGNDILKGGLGKDVFIFSTKLSTTDNRDAIADYNVADDSIYLDNAIFTRLGSGSATSPTKVNSSYFRVGDKALDANDYIIYNKSTGYLYYDGDGSGTGKAVLVATLSTNLAMTYGDFFVI